MSASPAFRVGLAIVLATASGGWVITQTAVQPVNDLPNPYTTVENYFRLPGGRSWGSTSAVDIDRDGVSVWVAERCGANSCAGSRLDPDNIEFAAIQRRTRLIDRGRHHAPPPLAPARVDRKIVEVRHRPAPAE